MKKRMLVLGALLMLLSVQLFSQGMNEEIIVEVNEALQEVQEELETMHLDLGIEMGSDGPYVGVYHENLDFEKARELHYNNMYGILITGIVPNSPAHYYRLREDDVLMEIDDEEVLNTKKFSSILKSYFVGDIVKFKVFRNEKEMDIEFTLGSRNQKISSTGEVIVTVETKDQKKKKKKKNSVGYGGGSWIPVWSMIDLTDINNVLTSLEFEPLREEGIFMQGGGGKGNIGKGWFIGGMGADYTIDRKIGVLINEGTVDEKNVTRRMVFNTGFGGVTLDKRFAISRKLIASVGFMLGGGGHELESSQTDGNYDWDTIGEDMESSDNNYAKLTKSYIMVQPKIMLMYRINGWLGIRAEGGYLKSYSYHSGWNAESCGDTFEVANSEETPYDGYTISIGPWFGF
jgi:hypothetical protein